MLFRQKVNYDDETWSNQIQTRHQSETKLINSIHTDDLFLRKLEIISSSSKEEKKKKTTIARSEAITKLINRYFSNEFSRHKVSLLEERERVIIPFCTHVSEACNLRDKRTIGNDDMIFCQLVFLANMNHRAETLWRRCSIGVTQWSLSSDRACTLDRGSHALASRSSKITAASVCSSRVLNPTLGASIVPRASHRSQVLFDYDWAVIPADGNNGTS